MKTLDMKEYNQSSITTPATQATPVNSSDLEYFQKVTSFSFPTGKISDTDKTALMDNIKSRLSNIALICDQVDSADLLENVYTALGGVLNSIKLPATKKRIASNKNMETQRKYFTTKKKRKLETTSLKKPSVDEVGVCKQQLNKTDTVICGICFCEDDQQVQSVNKSIGCHVHYVHCECTRTLFVLKT